MCVIPNLHFWRLMSCSYLIPVFVQFRGILQGLICSMFIWDGVSVPCKIICQLINRVYSSEMWAHFTFITGPWIRLVLLPSPWTPPCNVPGIHFSGIVVSWSIFVCLFRLLCRGPIASQMRARRDAATATGKLLHFGSFLGSSGQDVRSTDMSKVL